MNISLLFTILIIRLLFILTYWHKAILTVYNLVVTDEVSNTNINPIFLLFLWEEFKYNFQCSISIISISLCPVPRKLLSLWGKRPINNGEMHTVILLSGYENKRKFMNNCHILTRYLQIENDWSNWYTIFES